MIKDHMINKSPCNYMKNCNIQLEIKIENKRIIFIFKYNFYN